MAAEKAQALVLRTTDWSETSRIATLWTREFGKVRALAKGGRRLKSNFENALDLLTLCSIVFLRKSSGGLELLTEAQVLERFAPLRTDLTPSWEAPIQGKPVHLAWTNGHLLVSTREGRVYCFGTEPVELPCQHDLRPAPAVPRHEHPDSPVGDQRQHGALHRPGGRRLLLQRP